VAGSTRTHGSTSTRDMNIPLGCTSLPTTNGRTAIGAGLRVSMSFHHCCNDIRWSPGEASTSPIDAANTARRAFRLMSQHETSRLSISGSASRSKGSCRIRRAASSKLRRSIIAADPP
jgi:hypothetical protein